MTDNVFDTADSAREVTGKVKWFDPAKGYGFICSEEGQNDILLHQSCLREIGMERAHQGATIKCQVVQSPKGLQALKIIDVDNSTAIAESLVHQDYGKLIPVMDAAGDFEPASVKWFNRVRGYGFVTLGSGKPDVFLHMETVRRSGSEILDPGQNVIVRIGQGPKGLMVLEIKT